MVYFLKTRFKFLKTFCKFIWFIICKVFDFVRIRLNLSFMNNTNFYNYYFIKNNVSKIFDVVFNQNYLFVDKLHMYVLSKGYIYNNNVLMFRSFFRVLNTNQGFYLYFSKFYTSSNFFKNLKISLFSGLRSVWFGLRYWLLSLTIAVLIIYYSMVIRCLPFTKVTFIWLVMAMFSYWLISGFVFFIKKYQFGKYTSVIQRFWRRSYILFWGLEFCVFGVYFYLTLNANQESFYMFDQIQVFKTHLFSWRSFLFKLFPLTFLLLFTYLLLLSLKWNVFGKHISFIAIITFMLVYVVWVEFYQFFHVVNYYGNLNWIYDSDERLWTLELEPKKTRTVNHYVMFMLILKFWHIVFIFGFWVFFVLRSVEIGRVRYPLLSANLQNFVILYLFAWVVMYPWFKFIFRHYLDNPYYWFYVNNRKLGFRVFFCDFKLFYYGVVDYLSYVFNFKNKLNYDFFYFSFNNSDGSYVSHRKSVLKNIILRAL